MFDKSIYPIRLLPTIGSAQTNSPEQTFPYQNYQTYAPTNFSVLDRDLGKTAVFNLTNGGFNYWFQEESENIGIVQQTSLENTSMTLLENDLLKSAANGSARRNISIRVTATDSSGNPQQTIVSGILEDGGTTNDSKFTADVSRADGTPLKSITATIPKQQISNLLEHNNPESAEYIIVVVITILVVAAVISTIVWCGVVHQMCAQSCRSVCAYGVRSFTSWCGLQCQCYCYDRPRGMGGPLPNQY